jgi:hypothetical protein
MEPLGEEGQAVGRVDEAPSIANGEPHEAAGLGAVRMDDPVATAPIELA